MCILAMLFPMIPGPRASRSRIGITRVGINSLKTAVELYRIDHDGKCPKHLDDLIYPPSAHRPGDAVRWKGPYIDFARIPRDEWGNRYLYSVPAPTGEPYEIRSLGEDGREGGRGDAEDLSNLKR